MGLLRYLVNEAYKNELSENLKYHFDNNLPLSENIYRYNSDGYLTLINEVRELFESSMLEITDSEDLEFLESDAGKKGYYEGKEVNLDLPVVEENDDEPDFMIEGDNEGKELNKPKRNSGSGKKYVVYVKDPKTGNVKKITFGDAKGGLKAKINDPEARKAFSDRHNCPAKKDKLTPGYWACRLPRYAKSLGLAGSVKGYW